MSCQNFFIETSDEPSSDFFEKVLKLNELYLTTEDITISYHDYSFILKNPGKFTSLTFFYQGKSKWYFYHSFDGSKVFVIQTEIANKTYSWSWKKNNTGDLTIFKSKRKIGQHRTN